MAHNRKLVIGAVSLVLGEVKDDLKILGEIRSDLEPLLVTSDFFDGMPFRWIGLIIRYGLRESPNAEIGKINRRHGDLAVAIEVPMAELVTATREQVKTYLMRATLRALVDVVKEYRRDSMHLKKRIAMLGDSRDVRLGLSAARR